MSAIVLDRIRVASLRFATSLILTVPGRPENGKDKEQSSFDVASSVRKLERNLETEISTEGDRIIVRLRSALKSIQISGTLIGFVRFGSTREISRSFSGIRV